MKPELFDIPFIYYGVKGYGFMLMIGFLTGIWWATRRAMKVKANPDLILNVGFVALVFGVLGARAFYVIHYWERSYAGRGWGEVLNVTAGGMEFYGGFVGAMVFIIWYVACHGRPVAARLLGLVWIALVVAGLVAVGAWLLPGQGPMKVVLPIVLALIGIMLVRSLWQWSSRAAYGQPASLRMYLDIMTPSLMWGLAFGRLGCFLNGCCWGAVCENPKLPWAVQFPCSSPAQIDEWARCETTLPAPLIYIDPRTGYGNPIARDFLTMTPQKRLMGERRFEQAEQKLRELERAKAPEKDIARVRASLAQAAKLRDELSQTQLAKNMQIFGFTKPSDLEQLARRTDCLSQPVHPAQLYASVNAFLLAFLLNAIFYRRKRHGIVFGMMWLLYPIARIVEEAIRADNPLDAGAGILTISQTVSLGGIVFALVYFWAISKLPLRSPRAVAYVPPEPEPKKKM